MAYTRVNWQDLPSTATPRNATNLNIMDAGIKDIDDKVLGNASMGDITVSGITSTTGVDKYSTTETRVGTWIDGKPLYRRVFEIPTTSLSSSSTTAISINGIGTVNVIDVRGYIYVATSKYRYSINGMRTLDFGWRYDTQNHGMQLLVGTGLSAEGSVNGIAIVEYTKPND